MNIVADFYEAIMMEPTNYRELSESCRRIVDAWLLSGGDPHEEIIVGIYAIDSESRNIDPNDRNAIKEQDDFFEFYYKDYIDARDRLRKNFINCQ